MPAILTLMGVAALLVSLPGPFDDAASNATTQADSERRLTFQPTPAIAALPSKAKRWALIIGIDRYRDGQISPLKGAANDAHALAGALVQYAGFPADQVILLASDQPEERQPTRVNILRRLSNLKSLVPMDGLLLVSFAGHGIEREGQAFLLPSDAQVSEDVTFLEDTAVGVTRIRDGIRATGVKQVLLLLDACRNDPSGRADAPNVLTEGYTRGFNFDLRNREVDAFAILYATEVGKRAFEYIEKRQGYFTWAVVEGIRGAAGNQNGEVTLGRLVDYVQETVAKRTQIDMGAGKIQRPFANIQGYKANELVVAVSDARASAASALKDRPAETLPFELTFWNSIKDSRNPADFGEYIDKYPDGEFAGVARRRLESLATPPVGPAATGAEPNKTASAPLGGTRPIPETEPFKDARVDEMRKAVVLRTSLGDVTLAMDPDLAPEHVRNFLKLVESGWYDRTAFHRIIAGFVIQGGLGSTRDGNKPHKADEWVRKLKPEFSQRARHVRGVLSMARASDPNSADTSFFIVLGDTRNLDGKYTIFGKVVGGFDTIDRIEKAPRSGETPVQRIELIEATIKR